MIKRSFLFVLLAISVPVQAIDTRNNEELIELGKKLFFDPRLSADGTVSCNSCHNLMANGSDGRPSSVGVGGKVGTRKSPTVWNSQAYNFFFWDGRAASLEEQSKGPLVNPIEMAMPNHKAVEERLHKIGYKALFEKVFKTKDAVKIDNFALAVASFERSLFVRNSRFDQFLAGKKEAITEQAKKGYQLVQDLGCMSCHNGPDFAGPQIPDSPFLMKFPTLPNNEIENQYKISQDLGRFQTTKKDTDKNMWRVQSWRNVALTAPYFHNGTVKTLQEAVRIMAKVQLNRDLKKQEIDDIVAFLDSLTSEFPKITLPELPMIKKESLF